MHEADVRTGPDGTRFHQIQVFETLDSTNRHLIDEGRRGEREGLVVVARHQTSGRGRRGRVWDSKPGASLLFSVMFRPELPAHRYGQALALAVSDACQLYAGFSTSLKWPNDVLVGYRKLAGILVEAVTEGDVTILAAGCGVNVNWGDDFPRALRDSAISADEAAGQPLDLDVMLDRVLRALEERLRDSSWIAEAYRRRCSTIGQHVRVELADETIEGTAVDVDDDGALVVEAGDGDRRKLTSGVVVHVRGAGADRAG